MPRLTVVVEQCLAPVPGGTGRYARELTAALAASTPSGWTVSTVAAWHLDLRPARIAGVRGPRRLPAGRRVLAELWRRGAPPWPGGSSVHATTPLFVKGPGRPVVVTVHDAVPWSHPETLTPRGVLWHRVMIERAVRQAAAIITPTRAVADELAALFPQLGDRLTVIPHGVTPLPVPDDATARRAAFDLPPGYVLSLATLEPRKGLDLLIEALARPEAAGLTLAVVGRPGWGGLDLRELGRRHSVADGRIRVLGPLSDADLGAVLAGAAVLAAPSRAEGFGLPVLEAMAAGVPVVHSDAPALVEVAGGAGRVVPRGDSAALGAALAEVTGDDRLSAQMAAQGRSRATEFSWAEAARLTWEVHVRVARPR